MLVAFITGFLGSFHCVGMCGAIALSLPYRSWSGLLAYHLGKSLTYAFLGLLFGLMGRGLYLAGLQQTLSVLSGVLMIAFVLLPQVRWAKMTWLANTVKQLLVPFFKRKGLGATFMIGLLNGFLPCGLVYAAIFTAIASADAFWGSANMFAFGVGTMPLMLLLSKSPDFLSLQLRKKLFQFIPYFVVLVGILLILRGLNLGIPYLSPHFAPYIINCCHA
jgi:sulfite exporter TauE/SafE